MYYFTERESFNFLIKFVIITDFHKFYFFKTKEFESLFYKDKYLSQCYSELKSKTSQTIKNNEDFYRESQRYLNSEKFLVQFGQDFTQNSFF